MSGGDEVHGYLEVNDNGRWYLICNDDNSWNIKAASVVCNQLGYDQGAKEFGKGLNSKASLGLIDRQTSELMLNINCTGDETKLESCHFKQSRTRCDRTRHAAYVECQRPESGQTIRLSGSDQMNAGFLERAPSPGSPFQLVCDEDSSSWNQEEADAACRELGYDLGFGYNATLGTDSEDIISQRIDRQCGINKQALYLGCKIPKDLSCPPDYIFFRNKCYLIVHHFKSFLEAQSFCQNNGNGHLVEIKSQFENNFLSDYAIKNYTYINVPLWTGGVTTTGAGLLLNIWHSSKELMTFTKFYNQQGTSQSSGAVSYTHLTLPTNREV